MASASGFHLIFYLCLISGLLILGTRSASNEFNVPVPGCPPDWTPLGSRCFIFRNTHLTMADAESVCISLGGNLASIHSSEEHLLLQELIHKGSGSYSRAWVGGYDGLKEGLWMWTDGSRFDYHFWGPGEPNNSNGREHCVEMNFRGKWNDTPCYYGKVFVCAKDL